MEQQINCFQWENHSSDFLDGTLSPPEQDQAKKHLSTCKACSDRHQHYRIILQSIAGQRRTNVSAALRKQPQLLKFKWEHVPWFLRTLIEGFAIVMLVLLAISSTPKLRSLYEKGTERNLLDFKEMDLKSELDTDEPFVPPLSPPISRDLTRENSELDQDPPSEDDLAGEDDPDDSAPIHVGRSQLWRFTLKTVSPDELRPRVVKSLIELGIAPDTEGLGGLKVPGGIEFDLILDQSKVADVKQRLEKLAPPPLGDHPSPSGSETFSWYRVKSRRKIPEGKSQVVIWLSQPN